LTTNTSAKPSLHQRALHEFKELAIISAYLYITLGAVIMMKTAVLRTEGGVEFIPWVLALAGTDPVLPMELDPASAHGFVSG
jgi:hypothetical protein